MALDISDPMLTRGGGLEETGIGNLTRANQAGEAAAFSESERTMYNARVSAGNKMGMQELGGAVGSAAGRAVGGPLGAALGGMAGGLSAGLFG